jgi:hypothetical protein
VATTTRVNTQQSYLLTRHAGVQPAEAVRWLAPLMASEGDNQDGTRGGDPSAMDELQGWIDFPLNAPNVNLTVDVRLRRAGERWVARVVAHGEARFGLGRSARAALAAATAPLGTPVATALLADVGLVEPSLHLVTSGATARPG